MIITQTPLRISFFGGGTDFADFYHHEEGCVLSSAIDKGIFVIIKERFDHMIRVGYTRTELVEDVAMVEHELIREALKLTGVTRQIEVHTIGDIPSTGSGLGSSSTVTVGTLNALYTFRNQPRTQEELARQACEIEIHLLDKPIGKQDQYIAAYGGLRLIRFLPDERVVVEEINIPDCERRRFNQNLMLFYTNHARRSDEILQDQRNNIPSSMGVLRELKAMAYEGKLLLEKSDFDGFGRLLDHAWRLKKTLSKKISNSILDEMYQAAKRAGALGGKLTGAGGGGFLLLYCPYEHQARVREALAPLQELPFRLEKDGSRVILNHRN